jgi:hypothetical protein
MTMADHHPRKAGFVQYVCALAVLFHSGTSYQLAELAFGVREVVLMREMVGQQNTY